MMFACTLMMPIVIRTNGAKSLANESHRFVWGTSSSAWQYEGASHVDGRTPSVWDVFCENASKCLDTADRADGQYDLERLRGDIQRMKFLGTNAYRLSLSWSRVLPTRRGTPEPRAIEHYRAVLTMLRDEGIEAHVTLFHFDLPAYLERDLGGWLNEEIVNEFVRYAVVCFRSFGDLVKRWITINEAHTVATAGYLYGVAAPGRCSNREICREGNGTIEPYVVAHHMLLAHAGAVERFRQDGFADDGSTIVMTISGDHTEPDNTSDAGDRLAAESRQQFQIGWFADPIFLTGDYPPLMRERVGSRLPRFTEVQRRRLLGSSDYFSLNHYTSRYARAISTSTSCPPIPSLGWDDDQCSVNTPVSRSGHDIGRRPGNVDWLYSVPWGFRKLMNWIHARYGGIPITVSENGCTDPADMVNRSDDVARIDYLREYLSAMRSAIEEDGVDVRGYFVWSLLDNVEWSDGTATRFGLYRVDNDGPNATLRRTPKASALWFREYIMNEAVSIND